MGCHSIVCKREGEKGASCRLSFLFRGSDCACKVFVWQLRHIFSGHSSSAFATANLARHHRPGNRHNDHHHLGKQSSSCLSSSAMCYKSTKMALVIVPAGEGRARGTRKNVENFQFVVAFCIFIIFYIFFFIFFSSDTLLNFFFLSLPLALCFVPGSWNHSEAFETLPKCATDHTYQVVSQRQSPPLSFADRKVGGSLFYQCA